MIEASQMHRSLSIASGVALLFFAGFSLRAQDTWENIEANARKAIVKVRVIGDIDGSKVTEVGTGFLIRAKDGPRVITAGHVIGADSKWDNVRERLIFIRQVGYGSSIEAEPVSEARVEPDVDIAQVFLQQYDPVTLAIFAAELDAGSKLDVGSWAKTDKIAKFQVVDLMSVRDPDRMHLSGDYEPSHSGSPV